MSPVPNMRPSSLTPSEARNDTGVLPTTRLSSDVEGLAEALASFAAEVGDEEAICVFVGSRPLVWGDEAQPVHRAQISKKVNREPVPDTARLRRTRQVDGMTFRPSSASFAT